MTKAIGKDIIKSLPPGLTLSKAAKLLRYSQSSVRRWMEATGYEWAKNEKSLVPKWAKGINWKMTNSDIARQLGFSREQRSEALG